MTTIPDHTIEAARATDLVQLAQRYGVELRKESASSWCGPCPQCGGSDRFWIRESNQESVGATVPPAAHLANAASGHRP